MEKALITKKVFEKVSNKPIKFKEIDIDIQPDDEIEAGYDEGYISTDSASDPFYYLYVFRVRLETDEEFEERKKRLKEMAERNRKARYQKYLELKKEFEG